MLNEPEKLVSMLLETSGNSVVPDPAAGRSILGLVPSVAGPAINAMVNPPPVASAPDTFKGAVPRQVCTAAGKAESGLMVAVPVIGAPAVAAWANVAVTVKLWPAGDVGVKVPV